MIGRFASIMTSVNEVIALRGFDDLAAAANHVRLETNVG